MLSTVTSSAVAEADIKDTLFCIAIGVAAFVFPEVAGPNIATTLSLVASLVATLAASAFSDLLSTFTSSICFPKNVHHFYLFLSQQAQFHLLDFVHMLQLVLIVHN